MKKNASPRVLATWLLTALGIGYVLNTTSNAYAQSNLRVDGTLDAFVEPVQIIQAAAPDSGRVARVEVKRGSRVKAGDLLVELDTSVLMSARRVASQKAESTSRLEAAQIQFQKLNNRWETLSRLSKEGGGTTPDELRDAEAEASIARLAVATAEEDLVRAKLELEQLDTQIEQKRIRATIEGIVIDVHRDPGEFVSVSAPEVVTIVDLSKLRATFYLPTETIQTIQQDSEVSITFPQTRQVAKGVVEYYGPVTQADSGRVRVDIIVDNAKREFRSGLRCSLQFTEKQAVTRTNLELTR